MAEILNVLCLEDSPKDAELIREFLIDSGYQLNMDCTAVENEFVSFLRGRRYDIILSDFKLPGFDAFAALKWSVEICPEVPFICVSGTVGEETAIELLKKGAVDYILKDRLIRLPSAIQRAIEESKEKKARLQAEMALNESEERFRSLFENSTVGIYRTTPDGQILLANPALVKFLGFASFEDLAERNLEEKGFEPSYERSHFTDSMNREGVVKGMESVWTRIDGSKLYVSESARAIHDKNGRILYFDGIVEDISIRKQAEEKLNQQYYILKCITESSGGPFFSLDKTYKYTSFNKAHATVMKLIYGADIELGVSLFEYQKVEDDKIKAKENLDRALTGEFVEERAWSGKDIGKLRLFEVTHNPIYNEENEVIGVAVNAKDLTERELIEARLKESEELYGKLFHNMLNGFAYCQMLYDKGSPSDFIYLGVNRAFEEQTGLKNVTGKKVSEVIPGIQKSDPELLERYARVASTGNPEVFETFVESMKMWFSISVYSPQKDYFVAVFDGITERKLNEEKIRDLAKFPAENPDPVLRVDSHGCLLYANDASYNLLTWKLEIGVQAPQVLKEVTSEVLNSGIRKKIEKEHNSRLFSFNIFPVTDSGYVNIYGRDITERKLAELALQESEDKFKYIFDYSVTGKSITLPSGEIHVNRAFCEITGYSSTELENKKWQEISHLDDIAPTEKTIKSLISGEKQTARFTKRYIQKNGSIVWADVGTSLRRDKEGNPLYFVTSVMDITERKKAEEALHLKNLVFDASIAANSISGLDGKITETNHAFLLLWGYKEKEKVIGKPISEFIKNSKDANLIVTALQKKGEWEGYYTAIREDGSTFIAHGLATTVKDESGKVIGYQSAVIDVTDSKNKEEEIRKLNEELEHRVIQRTEQLEAANKELEAFSYSVSHDLRAPLRAVHGYTKILLDEYENKLDDEGKRLFRIVYSSASQMGELIDDLLNFSRIGRSSMAPSLIDMKAMVMNVFNELNPKTANRVINMTISMLNKAHGDPALIKLVWTNLISNALKYSSKQEISEISIGSSVRDGMITYHITDNGVGFDMTYKHKLFGVFQRLHTEKEFEGNGVGLAIVQRIISKHGGQVWAEAEVDKGATFYFSLPVSGD